MTMEAWFSISGAIANMVLATEIIHTMFHQPIALRMDRPCLPETRKLSTSGHSNALHNPATPPAIQITQASEKYNGKEQTAACNMSNRARMVRGEQTDAIALAHREEHNAPIM